MRLTDQVFQAIRWDTAGTLAASTINFLATVWMVRRLGPDRFGALAALLAVLGLGQLLASVGIQYALLRFIPEAMREGGPPAAARLLARAALGRTAALMVIAVPLWVASDAVTAIGLGRPELARYVRLLPLLLAPTLYADILSASLVALFRQAAVRTADVVNKLAFALGLLWLPAWRDVLYGVFAAWIAGWAAGIGCLATDAAKQGLLRRPARAARVPAGRWVRFSGTAYTLSLLGYVLGREMDILLLTRLGIPGEAVAQYAVGFAFVAAVLALPLVPIAGGFDVPLIARLYGREDWNGLRRLFHAFFEYVYIFMVPLVGGGLLLGPALVSRIYGATYGRATDVLLPLLVLLGLTKLGGVTAPFLMATDREGLLLRVRLAMAAVNLGTALLAIPRFGAPGAALATGLSMLGLVVWEALLVQRFLHPCYPWGFLARVAVATGVMMGAVGAGRLALEPDPGLVALLALVALGGCVYLAMLLWLRPVSPEHADTLAGGRVPGLARLVRRLARPAALGGPALTDPGQAGARPGPVVAGTDRSSGT